MTRMSAARSAGFFQEVNFRVGGIRELWIDVYTYQIVQLKMQGNFTAAAMPNVQWLVTFQEIDGNIYIKNKTALEPLVFHHDRSFSTESITFDDIRETDSYPPILPTVNGDADINLREPVSE